MKSYNTISVHKKITGHKMKLTYICGFKRVQNDCGSETQDELFMDQKMWAKIPEEFLEAVSYHSRSHGKHLQWLLGTLSSAVISTKVLCHE